ncbi:MAG TPA: NAD-dependent epimerase/dehydratase family protein [Candidatus Koribacter sp.]|jgi:dTDP-glucose 4,6-dehydratase
MVRALAADLDHVLDHTRESWEELRGQRMFITGGTGFFGRWLLESFTWANERLNLGARAMVLTRNPDRFHTVAPHLAGNAAVELLAGDVKSFEFPAGEFSHVIHAATDSAVAQSAIEEMKTIVRGTERCLEFTMRAKSRKMLFTSSGAVYGKQPAEIRHISEEYAGAPDPLLASSAYGEAKRLAELQCVLAAQGSQVEVKIARCFAFVGPYMNLNVHFAVGNFLRDQMRGGPIVVKGDGTAVRSYLYAADLAIWLWTMLFRAPSGRAYNVGSEESVSIAELANAVAGIAEPKSEVRIEGKPTGAPPARYVPATQRAERELGLRQWISLPDALSRTREWFLADAKS